METMFDSLHLRSKMSEDVQRLYNHLIHKALGDRSKEWFTQDMFDNVVPRKNVNEPYPLWRPIEQCSVIVRRAIAIDRMLQAMTNEEYSRKTRTAEILVGDKLLGVMAMGSNGLGKMFPHFLTENELRAGSITNRNASSLFGHNTMDYKELLRDGLLKKIEDCSKQLDLLSPQIKSEKYEVKVLIEEHEKLKEIDSNSVDCEASLQVLREHQARLISKKKKFDFYWAVKLSCQAVVDYAHRYADLAEKKAIEQLDRRDELLELARIARKVPQYPAETFHEAMQSICFFHIALHASMNYISLGRLDQVLDPYLKKEKDLNHALEVFECFIIKCAGRLNLSSNYLVEQDHVEYATVLGTHPYYIDQKAGVNNFLQNIIIGGKKPDGTDATNMCTFMILQAFQNVNLSTPGIYVRLHKKSPKALIRKIAVSLQETKNNPSILNDEVMIPAMLEALMQDEEDTPEVRGQMERLANDYCVDGCWEPILNGKSDWTFGMITGLQAIESALNQGASLQKDEEVLRGSKVSPRTPIPTSYPELMSNVAQHLQFFVDQSVMSLFIYYMMDENSAPSPLFSAYLEGCMDKGRDKACGGANHNLGGVILGAVPDMVNQLAAIKKWVFDEKKYHLKDVCEAIRENFGVGQTNLTARKEALYQHMRNDFDTNSPKFGVNDIDADDITCELLDMFKLCVDKAAHFGKYLFQETPPADKWIEIANLRALAGYYGLPLGMTYDIKMKVTAGLGTFEQYNWSGRGAAASANRLNGMPIAPNFSCVPGTSHKGVLSTLNSISKFQLSRFAAGVITDVCLEESTCDVGMLEQLIQSFVAKHGGMLTVAVGSKGLYEEIYVTAKDAMLKSEAESALMLSPYAGVNVRIGGWQTPFVALPLSHMENYIKRPENMN